MAEIRGRAGIHPPPLCVRVTKKGLCVRVLSKYRDNLCTSDLPFSFKQKNSTNICTMVLIENIAYRVASKAIDRVN